MLNMSKLLIKKAENVRPLREVILDETLLYTLDIQAPTAKFLKSFNPTSKFQLCLRDCLRDWPKKIIQKISPQKAYPNALQRAN